MRFNLYKTGSALVSLVLLCTSGAALPDASTSWTPVIEQKRPLFHDLSNVYPGRINNPGGIIELAEQKSVRGRVGNWLEKFHILDPQQKVTLRISDRCIGDQHVAAVSWAFPKGHYFPQNIELDADKINVIAWRSFPVMAKVKCKDEDEFQTYTTWVTVD